MKKNVLLLLSACLILSLTAGVSSGQSRFLDLNQNGFGVAAVLGSGEDYSSLGASLGYSFGAKFELGVGLFRSSFDDEVIGNDGSGTEVAPYLLASLVRPTETSNVGVEVGASYNSASFSSDALDALNWDMSATGYSIGANLYLRVTGSPTLAVYPVISADYMSVSATIEDSFGGSVDDDNSDVALGAGVSLLFNKKIVVTPAFRTFDGESSWTVSVGLILPSS